MSDRAKIKSFLQELKEIIKVWDVFFVNRPKNSVQNLADLGITANLRKEIIQQLEVEDYSEGPLQESQQGGDEMWIFGKIINSQDVYIKLTISKTGGAICISFHKAEYVMIFPFKNQTKE